MPAANVINRIIEPGGEVKQGLSVVVEFGREKIGL
jgi:hypothetical protein